MFACCDPAPFLYAGLTLVLLIAILLLRKAALKKNRK